MIWNILQLIFCAMLFAVPMALYKSNRTFMARFYNAMVYREKARRLYVQILLILLLLFHYVYACGHVGEFGILLFDRSLCRYLFVQADGPLAETFARQDILVCCSGNNCTGHRLCTASVHAGSHRRLSSFGCPVLSLRSGSNDRIRRFRPDYRMDATSSTAGRKLS